MWRRRLLACVVGIAVLLTGVLRAAWVTAPAPVRPKEMVLGRLRAVGGRFVPSRAISPVLQRAIVATEDERFYRHHGIDLIGLTRAFAYDAPLGNGSSLPPIQAEIVAPDTSFARLPLAAGLMLLVIGLASFLGARRVRRPFAFGLAAVVGVAAVSLIARSVKVA